MLHDVERRYQIKRAVFVRKLLCRAKLHVLEPTLATKRECIFRKIDTFRIAILRKHQKVRARATTNVEYAWPAISHTATNILEKTRKDLTLSGILPVRLL